MSIDLNKWMEIYNWIAAKLGIEPWRDRYSTLLLSKLINNNYVKQEEISNKISGKNVVIIGFGRELDSELEILSSFKHMLYNTVIVVADKAIGKALEYGLKIDIFVTDLDSDPEYYSVLPRETVFAIHAHGDNVDKIETIVPKLMSRGYRIHGTTQVEPVWNVFNYGGFTDGDRAVYLTTYYKPRRVVLVSMDFNKQLSKPVVDKYYSNSLKLVGKIKKLEIAEKLLENLVCTTYTEVYTLSRNNIKCLTRINNNQLLTIIKDSINPI